MDDNWNFLHHHLSPEQSSAIRNRPATPLDFERHAARSTRLPSDSTAEPIDYEMALDIEEQASISIRTKRQTKGPETNGAAGQDENEHCNEKDNADNSSETAEDRPDFKAPFELLPTGMKSVNDRDNDFDDADNAVDEEESIHKESDGAAAGSTPQSDETAETPEEYSPDNKTSVLSNIYIAPPFQGRNNDARRPFLGPFAWTVPSRGGRQESRPFLIYQDPEGYEPAETSMNPYWHMTVSDDKENAPPGSRMADSPVEDNIVADAENIVHLAVGRNGIGEIASSNNSRADFFHSARHGHVARNSIDNVLQVDELQQDMELSVSLGSTPTASPARSQHRHSSSIHLASSPGRHVIENMEVLNGRAWGGGLFRRRAGSSSTRL